MIATAASVDTRVRVLRLLKVIATVLFERPVLSESGASPSFTDFLWVAALRTRLVNSVGLRSLIDIR